MQLRLPRRPVLDSAVQLESIGTKIRLISNLFPLKLENNSSSGSDEPHNKSKQALQSNEYKCFQYSIDFEPEVEPNNRQLRQQIFKKSKVNLEKIIGKFCFSGECLFTLKKLNKEHLQKLEDPRTTEPVLVNNIKYSSRIRFVKEFDVNEDEANQQGQLIQKKGNQVTQILNIIMKSILREEKFTEIGKNSKFFEKDFQLVQFMENGFTHVLEAYAGLQFGVHPAAGKLYLMVDFASRILRQESALDFLIGSSQGQYGSIVGESVITKYNNFSIYKIDGVDRSKNPNSTFFSNTKNMEISFADYYKERYNLRIRDLRQPLLLHLRKYREPNTNKQLIDQVYLVPELCQMTGLTDDMRKNRSMMQELSKHTKLEPKDRFEVSKSYGELLAKKSRQSGVRIDTQNSTVNAVQLRPPNIRFGLDQSMTPHEGNYNFKNPIYDRTEFTDWSLIYPQRLENDVLWFIDELIRLSSTYGIIVKKPFLFGTQSMNFDEWRQLLDEDFSQNSLPSFVLSYSQQNQALYQKLKKFLYLEAGIEHQHLNAKSLSRNSASVISKVALQIAAKLGKRLWQVEIPQGVSRNTMIIGIETSMKRLRENNQMKQVVGVVASITRDLATYYSEVEIRNDQDTQLPTLSKIIRSAIDAYFKKNKELVDEVIIYRQGVGEGQINQSLQHEIQAVKNGFESYQKGYKPRFAFFQVNKKIGQKFYQEQRGKLVNPTSGSLIAQDVVGDNFEFYLCAQNCNSGVCTPTKYTCLYNDTRLSEPTVWQITYFQCYNYYNWQGPVRVPAAMMYAGKLAKFTSEVIGQKALNDLVKSLYYL